jgi:hypothetical protein
MPNGSVSTIHDGYEVRQTQPSIAAVTLSWQRPNTYRDPRRQQTRTPGADFIPFCRLMYAGLIASGRVSRLAFRMPAQTERGGATHFLRLARRQGDDCKET